MTVAARAVAEKKVFGQRSYDVIADLSGREKQVDRAAIAVADGMSLDVHPALVRPLRRPRWSLGPLFSRPDWIRAMCLQVSGVDHHWLLFSMLSDPASHLLRKNALVAPSLIKRLVRTLLFGRIAPP